MTSTSTLVGRAGNPRRSMPLRTRAAGAVIDLLSRPPVHEVPVDQLPALRERRKKVLRTPAGRIVAGTPHPLALALDTSLDAPGGPPIPARIYRRRGSTGGRPVVMYFHGGGWVFGDPRQSEWLCSRLAADSDVVVVSVDYRMAPEHPFPVPVEDCYRATEFVAADALQFGADATDMTVMGDSAGGNLAAVVALLARDRSGPAISRQVLIYPAVELFDTLPSQRRLARAPILSSDSMDAFKRIYLNGADPAHPWASPARAESLAGLPAALIVTAEVDPLVDNGTLYARLLTQAGVPTRYSEYRGAVHGFLSLPGISPSAPQALWEIEHFITAPARA